MYQMNFTMTARLSFQHTNKIYESFFSLVAVIGILDEVRKKLNFNS